MIIMVAGIALAAYSVFSPTRLAPPVDVLLDQSRIIVAHGVYYDQIVVQNRAAENLTIVVVIRTPLDAAQRMSGPVPVCGLCRATVIIQEVQPQPGQNTVYYMEAVDNPVYVRSEYPPTPLTTFANLAGPLGFGAFTLGILLVAYVRSRSSRW